MATRREKGASGLTSAIFIIIFCAIGYALYNIVPFFYYYYDLENQAATLLKNADKLTDDQILDKLEQEIERLGIPATRKSCKVVRGNGYTKLQVFYEEEFYVRASGKDYTIWKFPFEIDLYSEP